MSEMGRVAYETFRRLWKKGAFANYRDPVDTRPESYWESWDAVAEAVIAANKVVTTLDKLVPRSTCPEPEEIGQGPASEPKKQIDWLSINRSCA